MRLIFECILLFVAVFFAYKWAKAKWNFQLDVTYDVHRNEILIIWYDLPGGYKRTFKKLFTLTRNLDD